jgi:predicted DNA-binding transcriptional regulator AlpA
MFAFLRVITAAAAIFLAAPLVASSHINLIAPLTATAVLPVAIPERRSRRYLRKRQVAARYGVDERTIDRMTKDGRLPPYIYLPGSRLPLQLEAELDRRDDEAAATRAERELVSETPAQTTA